MRQRRLLLLAMTVVAIAVAAPAVAHAQATRTVTGVVVDNQGGAAVAGATIKVKDTPAVTATTAADGGFVLAKVAITDVVLQIEAADYAPIEVTVKAGRTGAVVAVSISKRTTAPPPTRVVTGLVRDATSGAPVAGATIKVQGTQLEVTSDADGLFVIPSVPPGDIVLEGAAPDHSAAVVTVAAADSTAKIALASTAAAPPPPPVTPTTRAIHGRVVEAVTGDPVAFATVTVAGTGSSVLTDEKGEFTVVDLPLAPLSLAFASTGYKDLTINVPANVSEVTATLELTAGEEIFVTGRAPVIVKSNLANGASVINAEDLNRVSAPTLDTAMQGKISGANLQYNSGAPGGGAQLRLRGISTINGQSSPLYVIDGVLVSNVAIASGANAITAAAAGGSSSSQDNPVNRVADLNPNDIEDVEVLKGAAAAALYGSKAANGVVIITTKHGRTGKTVVAATQRFGFSQISNKLGSRKFTSADEVMAAYKKIPAAVDAFNQGQTFDHEGELSQVKLAEETIVSAGGGDERGNYFGSVLVRDEPGVIIGTGYSKQSGRIGVGWDFGKRLRVAMTANLLHSSADRGLFNNDNTGTSMYVVLSSTPSFFDLHKGANGFYPANPFVGAGTNPLQTAALFKNNEDVWRFIGATNAALKLWQDKLQSVTLQGNFGFDRFHQKNTLFSPPELIFEPADGLPGTSIDANSSNLNWNLGVSAVYAFQPEDKKWRSALTGGATYEVTDLTSVYVTSQALTASQQNVDSGTAVTLRENRLRTRDQGFYLQEEIAALEEKLSVLAGVLAERSSLNGDPDHLYLFPKLAATYAIPQKALDLLRVRAAFGEAGNRPNYGQKFTPLNATTNIGGNGGLVVNFPTGALAGDANIKPERQLEVEAGIDAAGKDQRFAVELTVYQRNISDLLLQRTLAPSTGFTTQFFNGGTMRNRGVEAAVQVVAIPEPVEWTSRAIFTLNRSQITSLPVPTFDVSTVGFGAGLGAYRIEEGKSATQIVGSVGDHVEVVGNGEPTFRVGWANNFKWKRLGLTSLFDWQQGSSIINLTRLLYDAGGVSHDVDAGKARLKAFSDGDIRPYIERGTFVKLREVSVYWQLPDAWAHAIGPVDVLRLSVSGRNLLTFTHYSGLDPEVSNFGNQPIGRNYDVAPYPPSRSFWFSIEAGF
jgi:TonB-dependent SusC/RagA subfamily outer membrane receptor